MSRRKLHFDVRKNYARKRSRAPEIASPPPPLKQLCRLPLSVYIAAQAPDIGTLHKRLIVLPDLIQSWTCSLLLPDQGLAIYKLHKPLQSICTKYMLTVGSDFTWTLTVGAKEVDRSSSSLFTHGPMCCSLWTMSGPS